MHDQAEYLRHRYLNEEQAKTIAVVSGKGGVGKSNTALNFSLEMQKKGKNVLLIDLDVGMGNIEILLGKSSTYSINDLFNEFIPLHDMIELGPYNLSYITGGSSLQTIFQLDEQKLNYFYTQYNQAVRKFDYILFDIGAGSSYNNLAFIRASDECFIITTPEPTAITDGYSMIKHIVQRQAEMPIYVLMNRCENTKEGAQMLEKFKQIVHQFLQHDIYKLGMLPDDKTVQKAVMSQTPYLVYNPYAAVSKAMSDIVTNYLQSTVDLNELTTTTFIQRLKQLLTKR